MAGKFIGIGVAAVFILLYLVTRDNSTTGSHSGHNHGDHHHEASETTSTTKKPSSPDDLIYIEFTTTKGTIIVEANPAWAPLGVARLRAMVEEDFFGGDGIALFRTVPGFVSQFGIHGDPQVSAQWRQRVIKDDPVRSSNVRGSLTFATAGANTRTTQLFFNLVDNTSLDGMGFAPLAKCVRHCNVLDLINNEYGERPNQGAIQARGNAYLKADFPNLDYITSARVLLELPADAAE